MAVCKGRAIWISIIFATRGEFTYDHLPVVSQGWLLNFLQWSMCRERKYSTIIARICMYVVNVRVFKRKCCCKACVVLFSQVATRGWVYPVPGMVFLVPVVFFFPGMVFSVPRRVFLVPTKVCLVPTVFWVPAWVFWVPTSSTRPGLKNPCSIITPGCY